MAALEYFDDVEDPQLRANVDTGKAELLCEIGEWAGAFDFGMQVDTMVNWQGIWYALTAAAWLGDLAKAELASDALEGREVFPAIDRYAEAIRLGLEGKIEEAAAAFLEVQEAWEVRLLDDDLATIRAVFARVVGPENPAAAEAARAAHDWLVQTGTRSLLAAWAPVLPEDATFRSAAG